MLTKSLLFSFIVASGLALATGAQARTTHQVTATCKDGTSFTGTSKHGACHKHGGVKEWTTAATSPSAAAPTGTHTRKKTKGATAAASGGHAGDVWVNKNSKVYHCAGDKYYGKTKSGEYLTEAAAKSAGYHPAHGKACKS